MTTSTDGDLDINFKWSNSCRLCLATEAEIDIFAGESSTDIIQKIQTFLNVLIYGGDPLPRKLCSSCLEQLESWKRFRERCLETEADLKRKLAPYRRIDFVQEYFDRYAQFIAGDVVSSSSKFLESVQASDENSTISASDVSVQEVRILNNSSRENKKQVADSTITISAIKTELESIPVHTIEIDSVDKSLEFSLQKPYNLRRSSRSINFRSDSVESGDLVTAEPVKFEYYIHEKRKITPWKCEPCALYFRSRHALYIHQDSTNCCGNDLDGFRCKICSRLFFSEEDLADHQVVHLRIAHHLLDTDLLTCQRCPMKFPDQTRLKLHQLTHLVKMKMKPIAPPPTVTKKNKEFKCQICSEEFTTAQEFAAHRHHRRLQRLSTTPATSAFPCSFCTMVCDTEDELYDHRFANHGMPDERKKCERCDKKWRDETALKKHFALVHGKRVESLSATASPSNTVRCARCGHRFATIADLQNHEALKHKNPTPYSCRRCGVRFSARSHLLLHLRSHLPKTDPEYKEEAALTLHCSMCSSLFSRQDDLDAHLKTHESSVEVTNTTTTTMASTANDVATRTKGTEPSKKRYARFECSLCQSIFCKSTSIVRHANQAHPGQKAYIRRLKRPIMIQGLRPLKCQKCERWLPSRKAREAHMEKMHPGVMISRQQQQQHAASPVSISNQSPPLEEPKIRVKRNLGGPIATSNPVSASTDMCRPCVYCNKSIKRTYMVMHVRRFHYNEVYANAQEVDNPLQCKFCPKVCSSIHNKQSHERTHDPNRYKDRLCTNCNKVFDSMTKCQRHERGCRARLRVVSTVKAEVMDYLMEDDATTAMEEDPPELKPSERICLVCKNTYETANLLELHMMTAHGSMMFAGVPGPSQVGVSASPPREAINATSSSRPVALWRNEANRIIRKVNGEHQCLLCNVRFPNMQAAGWHQKNKHPRGNNFIAQLYEKCYQCTVCNAMMDSRDAALSHINVHTSGANNDSTQQSSPLTLPLPQQPPSPQSQFITHGASRVTSALSSATQSTSPGMQNSSANYNCPFCPSVFSNVDSIRSHIFYLHPDGSYDGS